MQPSDAKKLLEVLDLQLDNCPACGHSGPVSSLGDHWDDCVVAKLILFATDHDDDCGCETCVRWRRFLPFHAKAVATIAGGLGHTIEANFMDEKPQSPHPAGVEAREPEPLVARERDRVLRLLYLQELQYAQYITDDERSRRNELRAAIATGKDPIRWPQA